MLRSIKVKNSLLPISRPAHHLKTIFALNYLALLSSKTNSMKQEKVGKDVAGEELSDESMVHQHQANALDIEEARVCIDAEYVLQTLGASLMASIGFRE